MAISEQEAVATLRILVAVAQSDGELHPEERASLESALATIQLPRNITLRNLLDEDTNLDAQLAQITSTEGKEACYTSAYAMAYADGKASALEQKMLDHIKKTYNLPEEKTTLIGRMIGEAKDTVLPSSIKQISDPAKRAAEVKEDTMKYSILSAVIGAVPVPLVTDLAVIGAQIKLIRDVGQYYGHFIDKGAARSLLLGAGVGTGARIAVNSLCKLFPPLGMAVGATTSFASTYAVGKMAVAYFENNCKADMETLKRTFKEAQKEGKEQYSRKKDEIEKKQKANEDKVKKLSAERKAGKISEAEYEKKLAELA